MRDAMRKSVVTMAAVAGLGLIGMADGLAAPASRMSAVRTEDGGSLLQQIRYHRWRGHACYTKCYRDFVIGPRVCRTYC